MPAAEPVEKISWSRPPDMPEIEILKVENCRRLWCVYHQTYTICTVLRHGGLTDWAYRGRRHLLYNRHLMLLEPGELHRNLQHTAIGSFYVAQIDPAMVENLARESGLTAPPHFKIAQTATPGLFQAFAQFHAVVAHGGSLLARQSLFTRAVGRLLEECCERNPPPAPAPPPLRRARDYLHAHYADDVALEKLAKVAGLSRFHFLRSFARQFGLPPHAYQINLRIEKTRELLKAGVPVREIEAGFADQPHLIHHFMRLVGVTPGQYASMTGPRRADLSIVV